MNVEEATVQQGKRTLIGTPIADDYSDVIAVNEAWKNKIDQVHEQDVVIFRLNFNIDQETAKQSYLSCYPAEKAKQYDCRTCLAEIIKLMPYVYMGARGTIYSVFFDPDMFEVGTPMHKFAEKVTEDVRNYFSQLGFAAIDVKRLDRLPEVAEEDYAAIYSHTFLHFSLMRADHQRLIDVANRWPNTWTIPQYFELIKTTLETYPTSILKEGQAALASILEADDNFMVQLNTYIQEYDCRRDQVADLSPMSTITWRLLNLPKEALYAFKQVRSGAVSYLLDELVKDATRQEALESFGNATNSLVYGKKVADAGNQLLEQAGREFAQRGLLGALKRRLAYYHEIPEEAFIWKKAQAEEVKDQQDNPFLKLAQNTPVKQEEPIVYDMPKRVTAAGFMEELKKADRVFVELGNGLGTRFPYVILHRPVECDTGIIHTFDKPERRNDFTAAVPSLVHLNQAAQYFPPGDVFFNPFSNLIEVRGVTPGVAEWFNEDKEQLGCWFFHVIGATLDNVGSVISYEHVYNREALLPELRKYSRAIEQVQRAQGKAVAEKGNDCLALWVAEGTTVAQDVSFYLQTGNVRQKYVIAMW